MTPSRPRLRPHAALLALTVVAATSSTACIGDLTPDLCAADVGAKVEALLDATAAISARTVDLENRVLDACLNITQDLTGTRPAPTGSLDQQVTAACESARNAVSAAAAGATVSFAYAAPICSVDASAQLQCEASCDVDAQCTEGDVRIRCDAGDLSVVCSGTCAAGAVCEATVAAPTVQCQGSCDGVCEGTCTGTSNAAGECTGTCAGACRGNCTLDPGAAAVSCNAGARCRGGCSVSGTEPRCVAELEAPSCSVDADCQAGCVAQASFAASCDPAHLVVQVSGGSNAALASTLEENLVPMLEVRDGLAGLVTDATAIVGSSQAVITEIGASAGCLVTQLQQLTAAVSSTATVVTSMNVTITASVQVTASAGTPAN